MLQRVTVLMVLLFGVGCGQLYDFDDFRFGVADAGAGDVAAEGGSVGLPLSSEWWLREVRALDGAVRPLEVAVPPTEVSGDSDRPMPSADAEPVDSADAAVVDAGDATAVDVATPVDTADAGTPDVLTVDVADVAFVADVAPDVSMTPDTAVPVDVAAPVDVVPVVDVPVDVRDVPSADVTRDVSNDVMCPASCSTEEDCLADGCRVRHCYAHVCL